MDGSQLELPFDVHLQATLTTPEASSVKSLWLSLESQLSSLSDEGQLQAGAQAIAHLADVVEVKAAYLLGEWERRYAARSFEEPVIDAGMLTSVLRQSMQLNLEDALQPYNPLKSQHPSSREPVQSVVQEMDKADLLDLINDEQQVYEEAIAIADDEDLSAWIEAIAQCLHNDSISSSRIRLIDLQHHLNCPLIEVWLGLLLGNMGYLQQTERDFYALESIYVTDWGNGVER